MILRQARNSPAVASKEMTLQLISLLVVTICCSVVGYGFISRGQLLRTATRSDKLNHIRQITKLGSSALQKYLDERFGGTKDEIEELISRTEADSLLQFIDYKPWRAEKIKHLKYCYMPWKESWKQKLRVVDDDTVNVYTYPELRFEFSRDRLDEVWFFPWLWSQVKAERQSQLQKHFDEDYEALTAQEHIEMDCFLSEFDFGVRWSLVRFSEVDIFNVIALNLVTFTDFNGVRPTDLGLRPDGSVRTCPVQFHTCISSSNTDVDHYAPPLRWSRSKSPDQAYEEIKYIFYNYPKKGLMWTKGWIDRGGWKPQQFSGPYFHVKAESQVWHWAEDIEFKIDANKREVQYRSSARLGQIDWEVERNRYNEIVRLLDEKGGWENHQMPKSYYLRSTPWRWMQRTLDTDALSAEQLLDRIVVAVENDAGGSEGAVRRVVNELVDYVAPYVQPVVSTAEGALEQLQLDPAIASIMQSVRDLEQQLDSTLAANIDMQLVQEYVEKISALLSDRPAPTATVEDLMIRQDQPESQDNTDLNRESSDRKEPQGVSRDDNEESSIKVATPSPLSEDGSSNEYEGGWSNALLRALNIQKDGLKMPAADMEKNLLTPTPRSGYNVIDKLEFQKQFLNDAAVEGSKAVESSSSQNQAKYDPVEHVIEEADERSQRMNAGRDRLSKKITDEDEIVSKENEWQQRRREWLAAAKRSISDRNILEPIL